MKTKRSPKSTSSGDDDMPSVLSQVVVKRSGGTKHDQEPPLRRRRSGRTFVRSFTKNVPLIEQFDEIVKSAKQSAVKPLGLDPAVNMTPPRELRVKVEYLTPERIQQSRFSSLNSSFDAAPSPITPPFSQPHLRALCMEEEEDVPSPQVPQATTLTSHSMQCDPAEVSLKSNNDDSDPLFLDAEDVTPENNSGDLNIDVLIDEFIEKNPTNQDNQVGPSLLPELENLNLSFEDAKSVPPLNKSGSENKRLLGEAQSCVLSTVTLSSPDEAREMATERLPTSLVTKDTSTAGQCKTALTPLSGTSVSIADVSKNSSIQRNIQNAPPASMSTQQTDNQEAFSEDFNLSCSQLLDIDAQCNLLQDQSQKVPEVGPNPVNGQGARLPESKEEGLGFSIPQAPTFNWMQKAIESSQRLLAVTQQLSRLNAMVLRARKTLWPQQAAMSQPQQHQNPTSSNNMTSPPPAYPYYYNSEPPLMLDDQDWNIC